VKTCYIGWGTVVGAERMFMLQAQTHGTENTIMHRYLVSLSLSICIYSHQL